MKKRKLDVGECLYSIVEHRSSKGLSDDPLLESKHKIFLSHSGVQKEFVEHLCRALEDRCHYPFFDKHPESLPKGKEFPSLIVKVAQQCQLLVIVVSDEYFMSKWPMIELNVFLQASKVLKSNVNVAILPLFYGLSVSDLKDKKRRKKWYEKWETFALDDQEERIKVEDWNYALDELTKFSGLSYDQEMKAIVVYENEIVSHICRLVSPDIKWDDSHVQGNAHEVVLEKRKEIGLSPRYKVQVVGIYGVGGIGKTTMCKKLCNDLSMEYEGRVCHIEFDITCSNSKELLQKASIELTKKQVEAVQLLGEGECRDILKRNLFKQRTFLALDNVWDDDHSLKQALMFLNMDFHEESFVIVTARSQNILERLDIARSACLEMPELGQEEATMIGFNLLHPREQALFMDASFFVSRETQDPCFSEAFVATFHIHEGLFGWWDHLSNVHKSNARDIQSRLDNLTNKGLLQNSDFSLGKINIHDLYIEFAKPEAKGSFGETTDMENQRWMYIDDEDLSELEVTPVGGCWPKLTRLCIWQELFLFPNPITSLEGIEWQHFSNVWVLCLEGLWSVQGTLNLKGMKCLRSLRVRGLDYLDRLEGFSGLINLAIFEWRDRFSRRCGTKKTYFVGCFPSSLKFLSVHGKNIVLEPNVLAWCNLLCKLYLRDVDVGELLDLRNCSSLDTMELYSILKWQTSLVLCASKASKLKSLIIIWMTEAFINILVAIPRLNQIIGLEHLHLCGRGLQGFPNLLALTKLQSLRLKGLDKLPELCIPHQMRELHLVEGSFTAPNLNGLKQLQDLNLSFNHQVTHIFGMDDLIALRFLNLEDCKCLQRLPDLSKSRSLEDLSLNGCLVLKLYEEDIQMLATLPLLHHVHFSTFGAFPGKLDFARQKILYLMGSELDFKQPPISIFDDE